MPAASVTHPETTATGWRSAAPNAITAARLVLTVGMIAALSLAPSPAMLLTGAILFIVAAASDALDGWLARRWNAVSRFGRIADPLADKLLVLSAFVVMAGPALAERTGIAPWMPTVLIARELLVTTIRAELEAGGTDASSKLSGKAKMIVQSVTVPLVLLLAAREPEAAASPLALAAIWATLIVTVASGIPYLRTATGSRVRRRKKA